MPKLALVLGASGCGKGFVAKNCLSKPQIITVDLVREHAIALMCSNLKKDVQFGFCVWDMLLKYFTVHPTIAAGIIHWCGSISVSNDTIAEGGLLAHQEFRRAFLETLTRMGFAISETKLFFVDPEPENMFLNILKRLPDRPSDKSRTPESTKNDIDWYRLQMRGQDFVHTRSSDEAKVAVEQFLIS